MKQFPFGLPRATTTSSLLLILFAHALIFSSCQKEELAQPADDLGLITMTDQGSTATAAAFAIGDPELEGNDAADNLPPTQKDFLFDTSKELVVLEGTSVMNFWDEQLVNPVENLVGMTQQVDLFEPENDQRKVGSLAMTIQSIRSTGLNLATVTADVRFDFGHGTVFGVATLEFSPGATESGADFQCQLSEIELIGGTRMLQGQENKLQVQFLNGNLISISDDVIELSCNIGITL